jgi:hypothetical protein
MTWFAQLPSASGMRNAPPLAAPIVERLFGVGSMQK